jgi:hypothetical protein
MGKGKEEEGIIMVPLTVEEALKPRSHNCPRIGGSGIFAMSTFEP